MMAIKINPNGFQNKAPKTSPLRSDNTDRVDPQEGQGIPVMRLNIHTPDSPPLETLRLYVTKSQIYPAAQAVDKRAYNLLRFIKVSRGNFEFSAY